MQIDVSVHVSGNYRRVVAELELAARGGLRRELQQAIARAAKPATAAVKAEVPAYMPNSGGYAATLQRSLRLRIAQAGGGVRISAQAGGRAGKRDVGALEKGSLRHPVFGRYRVSHKQGRFIERPWVAQQVRPGFFTEPIQDERDEIAQEIHDAIQRVADKIAG